MCGIAGYVAPLGERAEGEVVEEMVRRIIHRGPDGRGVWVDGPVGLGHCRLAILDLEQGFQPMVEEGGEVGIVYNGEVYNFLELRAELEEEGYNFFTNCDTEVVLKSYLCWGEGCLERFNGMFAFAIWDRRRGILFLARDRLGQKPLYYINCRGYFLFASEPKAFFAHPVFTPVLDRVSLLQYLTYEYIPSRRSIYEGVKKLEAGHYLVLNVRGGGRVELVRYWDVEYGADEEYGEDFALAKERFLELLERSVRRRLISDVPLGVFLSGGIDSSSVVAMAARFFRGGGLKTFSISFSERSYDESFFIRRVVEFFGTEHYGKRLTPRRLYEVLPRLLGGMDEPFSDPSIIPTYLLSGFTRGFVKVALGGDGGDELFAGYDPFLAVGPANIWRRLPFFLHRWVGLWARRLPVSHRNVSFDFKVNRFLRGAYLDPARRYTFWMSAFLPEEFFFLFQPSFLEGLGDWEGLVLEPAYRALEPLGELERFSITGGIRYFTKLYLAEDILLKVDRASMLHSLEVRSPFLDVELVEFVNRLPERFKLNLFRTKYLFKEAVRGHLPSGIGGRRKKGFGIPVAVWLNTSLRSLVEELLARERLRSQGIFSPEYVWRLIEEHRFHRANHAKALWGLLIFQLWVRHWLPELEP